MLRKRIYIILSLLCCLSFSLYAQKSSVRATVHPSDILIGEHAIVELEVIAAKDKNIIFPLYLDTIVKGVEVLKMLPPDTVMTEVMTINQKYLITSFDSTLYHIPHMLVVDGNDTIKSNDFGFKVSAPQLSDSTLAYLEKLHAGETDSIDFEKLEIYDIKPVQPEEFVWTDYLEYFYIPLLVLLFFALIVVVYYFVTKKRKKGYFFKPEIILPPHVIAKEALEKLRNKKLAQSGMVKEYHTELTDIIRDYIAGRFDIDAPEMLTEDIIKAVHLATDTTASTDGLRQILTLADLVKFAKFQPLQDENDLSLMNASLFVNQTMIEEVKEVQEGDLKKEETPSNSVQKDKRVEK